MKKEMAKVDNVGEKLRNSAFINVTAGAGIVDARGLAQRQLRAPVWAMITNLMKASQATRPITVHFFLSGHSLNASMSSSSGEGYMRGSEPTLMTSAIVSSWDAASLRESHRCSIARTPLESPLRWAVRALWEGRCWACSSEAPLGSRLRRTSAQAQSALEYASSRTWRPELTCRRDRMRHIFNAHSMLLSTSANWRLDYITQVSIGEH